MEEIEELFLIVAIAQLGACVRQHWSSHGLMEEWLRLHESDPGERKNVDEGKLDEALADLERTCVASFRCSPGEAKELITKLKRLILEGRITERTISNECTDLRQLKRAIEML